MSMFRQTKRIGLCAAVAVGAMVLAGCATLDQGTPEEIVAKKAQAYWDARLAGDTKKAYEFTAPSYRADNDLAQFAKSAGRTYALSAKVKNVKCEADSCRSGMNLQIKPPFATVGAGTMDMYYAEKWVLEDGRWWLFVAP